MSDTRKLGLMGRALVALMVVVTAGLGVVAVVAMRAKRIETEQRRATEVVVGELRALVEFNFGTGPRSETTRISGFYGRIEVKECDDEAGQVRLRSETARFAGIARDSRGWSLIKSSRDEGRPSLNDISVVGACKRILAIEREVVLDAWGNPIYYRCPGPVHKNGWDLISCGPNGVYEEGGGDDIVVGEDLPGGLPPDSAPVTTERK